MLYVFHVDSGNMMTLDMSLATETVQRLKEYLEETYKIRAENQVLLISGGECLDSTKRVCSYSAGTDTNPIYLFSRNLYDDSCLQVSVLDFREEQEIFEKEKKSAELPPSFQTVTKRAQLAQEFSDKGRYLLRTCENLVTDQHNQHQGWAAVVANFEDVLMEFQCQFEQLKNDFEEYVQERDYFCQFLHKFHEGLQTLRKIPVHPKLLKPDDNTKYLMETSQTAEGAQNAFEEVKEANMTLFDWINSDDHENNLELMYERCCFALEFYNQYEYNKIAAEVGALLRSAGVKEMREIRGLGTRLFTLDGILRETREKLQVQNDLALAVVNNKGRVHDLMDSSILPDLCSTHIRQLDQLAQNHVKILESCAKCIATKEELSHNLNTRLQYVIHTQNHMQKIGDQIEVFIENIAKLRYQLGILEQVEMAPSAYLSFIAEIVRRRSFSQAFLVWASELACRLLTIHSEEVARRKDFQSKYEGHFIQALFPGMEDLPPAYGTQAPSYFDTGLPKLTHEDVEFFKKEMPEWAEFLNVPDFSEAPYQQLFKSLLNNESEKMDEAACTENMLEQGEDQNELAENVEKGLLKDGGSLVITHGLPHLKDLDRGCESETDTEEFEKVGQSPLELNFEKELPSARPGTQDASTLTEVGPIPPKKPPRTFQKVPTIQTSSVEEMAFPRTLSISGSQSNTESFTNVKNPSLESIDELSSLKNFSLNAESCFNSHYQQQAQTGSAGCHLLRSKSISPHTPLSPKDQAVESPKSPTAGHQHNDFVNDEFYIDESLPSSLSIETGQSQGDFGKHLDTANSVVALLQGNLEISKSQYDKLKTILFKLGKSATQTIVQLRTELDMVRSQYSHDKETILQQLQKVIMSCENLSTEHESQEKLLVQRLTAEHSSEISDFRKLAQVKNEEIKNLRSNNAFLENRVKKFGDELSKLKEESEANEVKRVEMEKRVAFLEMDKDRCVKEVTERLTREHRNEMKTLQARFKLMTMERTPSDGSLEKTLEFSSLTNHESIINQMRENFELEKEKAVNETIAREREKWEAAMEKLKAEKEAESGLILAELNGRFERERSETAVLFKRREEVLTEQMALYVKTIREMSQMDDENCDLRLMKMCRMFDSLNMSLSIELTKVMNMACGVEKKDASTETVKSSKSLSASMHSSSDRINRLSLDNVKVGDQLVVVWDEELENFKIAQDSNVYYFLHPDCLDPLGLEVAEGKPKKPNKYHCFVEYLGREYCHARKAGNRYKVPVGTRFFRVKVRPLERKGIPQPSSNIDIPMTQSHMPSHRTSSESTAEAEFRSLPSSPKIRAVSNESQPEFPSDSSGGNESDNKNL